MPGMNGGPFPRNGGVRKVGNNGSDSAPDTAGWLYAQATPVGRDRSIVAALEMAVPVMAIVGGREMRDGVEKICAAKPPLPILPLPPEIVRTISETTASLQLD